MKESVKKKKCKIIDDEFHLFFNCSINEALRKKYLSTLKFRKNLKIEEKIKIILNPETNICIYLISESPSEFIL